MTRSSRRRSRTASSSAPKYASSWPRIIARVAPLAVAGALVVLFALPARNGVAPVGAIDLQFAGSVDAALALLGPDDHRWASTRDSIVADEVFIGVYTIAFLAMVVFLATRRFRLARIVAVPAAAFALVTAIADQRENIALLAMMTDLAVAKHPNAPASARDHAAPAVDASASAARLKWVSYFITSLLLVPAGIGTKPRWRRLFVAVVVGGVAIGCASVLVKSRLGTTIGAALATSVLLAAYIPTEHRLRRLD